MTNQPVSVSKYLRTFLLLSFLWLSIIPLANYIIDPYGIFGTTFLEYDYQQNERFIKIESLKQNHGKYNAYIFGSSRVGTVTPQLLKQYLDDSRFYNLWASGGNQWDYRVQLEYLLDKQYDIDYIYLQVDFEPKYGPSTQHLLKMHPEVVAENLMLFYLHHLTIFPYSDLENTVKNNLKQEHSALYDWATGAYSRPNLEQRMRKNAKAYIAQTRDFHKKRFRKSVFSTKDRQDVDQNIKAIADIMQLAKANDIELYIFTTPLNQHKLDQLNTGMYLYYLSGLAKLTEFWDFSGYNPVTTNDENYYESSHYRPAINDLIAARVFTGGKQYSDTSFGVYVTDKNIEQHLLSTKAQFKQRDSLSINH